MNAEEHTPADRIYCDECQRNHPACFICGTRWPCMEYINAKLQEAS